MLRVIYTMYNIHVHNGVLVGVDDGLNDRVFVERVDGGQNRICFCGR